MTTLLIVGFVSGLVTAISPCVLPVLPVVLTTSVAREPSRWRPYVVIGGLVLSFGTFTLLGGALLSLLNLPQDLLRWAGIAVLVVVGLGLAWPRFGHLIEAPFVRARMPRLNRDGNGFVLGLGLGLVFVPCAGPILASITVLAATARIGPELVVLTVAYCLGVALPLLGFAIAGDRILARINRVRSRTTRMRARIRSPAIAKPSRGRATPRQYATVRTTSSGPIRAVAASTVIDARIGPAQGTKTNPRPSPRTKPLPSRFSRGIRARTNGASMMCPKRGHASPRPTTTRTAIPAQRSRSCGRFSRLSSAPPSRVNVPNESTRPPITTNGRQRDGCRATEVVRTTGSTGSTQGEIAVTRPDTKPTMSRVVMTYLRSARSGGSVRPPVRSVGAGGPGAGPSPPVRANLGTVARLGPTGVDPAITGEPPAEPGSVAKAPSSARHGSLSKTGRVGPSQP